MIALRRWAPRVVVVAVVVACVATLVVTRQDRADAEAAQRASLVAAAENGRRIEADATRTAGLILALDELRQGAASDDRATLRAAEVVDAIRSLRDRLELAQAQVLAAQDVSAEQRAQLDVLRGCVVTLDDARAHLAARRQAEATLALAAGRGACRRAEEITDGIVDAVHPFDFPDPDVLEVGGSYFAFGTNGPGGTIQVLSSSDLADWQVRGSALVDVPFWARRGQTWAPAVIPTWGGYLLYYTVRHREWGKQCISVARSSSPAGPYTDTSWGPIVCQTDFGGSIDPSPYRDETGASLLTWKSEGETVGQQAVLWSARLNDAGTALVGASHILATTDRGWESTVVEAPSMARVDGTWVLLYSGNDWRTDRYGIGYLRCLGPTGPCAKPDDNVLVRSGDQVRGPGGAEVFHTAAGTPMIAYAGWDPGGVGPPNPRRLYLAELRLTPEALSLA